MKAAGEEREVTLQELIEGYQKGTDYHKKTNQLAEQRKAVEAEICPTKTLLTVDLMVG